MLLTDLMNLPCLIVNRTSDGLDDFGNDVSSEATVETVCELQQRQRERQRGEDGEELATGSFLLVVPSGTVLGSADSVVVEGVEYEVSGEPWIVRNPRTHLPSHVEATVVRVAGAWEAGS